METDTETGTDTGTAGDADADAGADIVILGLCLNWTSWVVEIQIITSILTTLHATQGTGQ